MSNDRFRRSELQKKKKTDLLLLLPEDKRNGRWTKEKIILHLTNAPDRKNSCEISYAKIQDKDRRVKTPRKKSRNNKSEKVFQKRMDIMKCLFDSRELDSRTLYNMLMSEENTNPSDSRMGFIFETLIHCLTICKCFDFSWKNILSGKLSSTQRPIKSIKDLLDLPIEQGGDISDLTLELDDNSLVACSIKYKKKLSIGSSDIEKIDGEMKNHGIVGKIALFYKQELQEPRDPDRNATKIYHEIKESKLLFSENDVKTTVSVFCEKFSSFQGSFQDFLTMIETDYFGNSRVSLRYRLHQKITEMKLLKQLDQLLFCIYHKPRSGKTITALCICKRLMEEFGYKKILIMTSVKATICQFINSLNTFIDFKDISFKNQDEFMNIDETFHGLVFCSTQYLKMDIEKEKQKKLISLDFDLMIIDESHLGSSNRKTKNSILSSEDQDRKIHSSFQKKIKQTIFMSGTAKKTIQFYNIPPECVFEWTYEDEKMMSSIVDETIKEQMVKRHGPEFLTCLENDTLDKDYSKTPIPVYLKWKFNRELESKIQRYNLQHGENLGFDTKSLFALKEKNNPKGKKKFLSKFQICSDSYGEEVLVEYLDSIISNNRNKNTLMKVVEKTQDEYGSRRSTRENPLLFIIYLPTHTGNNTIDLLQKTLIQFLKKHSLWTDYNIEASCGKFNTNDNVEDYTNFIESMMERTKTSEKKGCILFLGQQGTTGITYDECDVTISLDDGHSMDNQNQRCSRALTNAPRKTIGINVDLNVQRYYNNLYLKICEFREKNNSSMTNAEILEYFYKYNFYLFSPDEINYGRWNDLEISNFYKKQTEMMMETATENLFLENIECDDDLNDICSNLKKNVPVIEPNSDLNGDNENLPPAGREEFEGNVIQSSSSSREQEEGDDVKDFEIVNKTRELLKVFFPFMALLSRSFGMNSFEEILDNEKFQSLMATFFHQKKIDLSKNKERIYISMKNHFKKNKKIIHDIRELYRNSSSKKIRFLVEKHFIPSKDEKDKHAEIPTPMKLVDEMLGTIPRSFWKKRQLVLEPCCGKGNFVLGIFDSFFVGLKRKYPNEKERCRVIVEQCLYYCDLNPLNVFITTELLKCHVEMKCGEQLPGLKFNSWVGDTLTLHPKKEWKVNGFNAVIGNPPYQQVSITGKSKGGGNNLYTPFIYWSNTHLLDNGILLFITPSTFFSPGRSSNKNELNIKKDIFEKYYFHYMNLNECGKYFKEGSSFVYYCLEKKKEKNSNLNIVCKYKNKVYRTTIHQNELFTCNYIPNLVSKESLNICKKIRNCKDEKLKIFNSTTFDKRRNYVLKKNKNETNEEYKKRALQTGFVYPIQATGKELVYSKIKCKNQNDKKIILSESGYLNPFYDDGIVGIGGHCFGLLVSNKTEGKKIIELLNSKLYRFYIEINKWSGFHHKMVLQDLPNVLLKLKSLQDNDIYKYFKLTRQEIKTIENI